MSVLDVFRSPATLEQRGRAANIDLYQGTGTGAMLVPNLDAPTIKDIPAAQVASNPIMFGPIFRLAFRMGSLPLKVYEFQKDGVRKDANDHPAYKLLRRPNTALTRSLLISGTVIDMFIHGKAAWYLSRLNGDGPPLEIWPLYAQQLHVVGDKRALTDGFELRPGSGPPIPLRAEDVCYFRLLPDTENLADGITPFTPLAKIAKLGATAIDAGADMFEHALLGTQSATSKRELSNRAFNRLKQQLQEARRNKFSIPLLEDDVELHDHPGPSDKVVMNALTASAQIVRETLGLPDDGDSTAFFKNAIQPIADAIEQELERSLMPNWPERAAFPEFAFRDELRGDPLQRAQLHQTRILSGQETPDEARRDENRPPLPDGAGDQAFVPLNLIPITFASAVGETGVPPATDSGGGLGGDEGKGTLTAASKRSRMSARARTSWATLRDRLIKAQSQAAARNLRGVINKEAKAIKAILAEGRTGRAAEAMPSIDEISVLVRDSDPDIEKVLARYMRQTGDSSAPHAAELVSVELSDAAVERLVDVYATRASAVAERFSGVRANRIISLVEDAVREGTSMRDLAGQISDAYQHLATNYVDGIARTEVAFAHEQAAMVTWADAGVRQVEVVFGGGPCSTGVCETNAEGSPFQLGQTMDNVGVSFDGADAPPFHPGCTCFSVPFIEED